MQVARKEQRIIILLLLLLLLLLLPYCSELVLVLWTVDIIIDRCYHHPPVLGSLAYTSNPCIYAHARFCQVGLETCLHISIKALTTLNDKTVYADSSPQKCLLLNQSPIHHPLHILLFGRFEFGSKSCVIDPMIASATPSYCA